MLFAQTWFALGVAILTIVGLPLAGFGGFVGGGIAKRTFGWRLNGTIVRLIDVPMGYAGSVLGLALAGWAGALGGMFVLPTLWEGFAAVVLSRFRMERAANWVASHAAVRFLSVANGCLLLFEVVRASHRHLSPTPIELVFVWMAASLILLPTAIGVEAWWMRITDSYDQRRAIAFDTAVVFGWLVLFAVLLPRLINL